MPPNDTKQKLAFCQGGYWAMEIMSFALQVLLFSFYLTAVIKAEKKIVRRGIHEEDCGRPSYGNKRVQSCWMAFHAKAFHKSCSSYPSEPRRLTHSFQFVKNLRKLHLDVSWDEPEYGQNTLWGYDVLLHDIHRHIQYCYQINGKDDSDRSFTFYNLTFATDYHVVVTSLPRRSRKMTNKVKVSIKSPDICQVYEKAELSLPLDCVKVEGLKVERQCNSTGIAAVVWSKPNLHYEGIFIELHSSCTFDVAESYIAKNINMFEMQYLELGCKYFLQIFMVSQKDHFWKFSAANNVSFSCFAKETITVLKLQTPTQSRVISRVKEMNISLKPFWIAIGIMPFLSVAFIVALCGRDKFFGRLPKRSSESLKINNNTIENKGISVLILQRHGCEYELQFGLLFANFLKANGFHIKYDVLDSLLIAEMGTAAYYETVEKESDFVIIIFSDNPVQNESNPFEFILNIIRTRTLKKEDPSRFIPIYYDRKSSVPVYLQSTAKRMPKALAGIMNHIQNDSIKRSVELMGNLKKARSKVLKSYHPPCDVTLCHKGTNSNPDRVRGESVA